jgi:hypothetical protein
MVRPWRSTVWVVGCTVCSPIDPSKRPCSSSHGIGSAVYDIGCLVKGFVSMRSGMYCMVLWQRLPCPADT